MNLDFKRREFCKSLGLGSMALALPGRLFGGGGEPGKPDKSAFAALTRGLLREWGEALLALQIWNPANPKEHGALSCPACGFIHGRCMDAVYPFLHLARTTGEERYLKAGIAVFEWSANVSQADGSWTVIPDPKSWKGITVFGTIALAEALRRHGDLLETGMRERWRARLAQAGDYLQRNFTLDFTNINYGCSAVLALHLTGRLLDLPEHTRRSRELAGGVKAYFTRPNFLLFGEGHEKGRSPRGLEAVDLGYNVEETLANLTVYAHETNDADLLALMGKSLAAHLEFMLPDGAWDNSWGTRQAKWSYWGSRTTDGCQLAYALMAERNPAFGAAAYQNTMLLKACTRGLLHGGPHYVSHGVKPCVHHTFTHAKVLAAILDDGGIASKIDPAAKLPRAIADGVKEFPEIATWLAARGPWRATVTAYDWRYNKNTFQPTGGALSMLWHRDLGPLLAGSMPKYVLVEPNNMQPDPDGEDHPLTPRVEAWVGEKWFTNLHDLKADVTHSDQDGAIQFNVATRLLDDAQAALPVGEVKAVLEYRFDHDSVIIRAKTSHADPSAIKAALVIPVISPTGEKVKRVGDRKLEIMKPQGTLVVEANVPMRLQPMKHERAFNPVPGFEALPLVFDFPPGAATTVECRLRVIP